METVDLWIDGCAVAPASGEYIESINPYTREAWGRVARGTSPDVERAVRAARDALENPDWRLMAPRQRAAMLFRIADVVERHHDHLARVEIRDNGKPISEVLPQVRNLRWVYQYYAGVADKIEGATIPVAAEGQLVYSTYEPVGVVAAITPWNSPLRLLALKLAPALAAGTTVVVKPSEHTSASTIEFVRLIEEAGLPAGVVNVVTGWGAEAGAALLAHEGVDKISLTGGTSAGERAYQAAAKDSRSVTLELGGKSPHIVFNDAELDAAIEGAAAGVFGSAGQTCIAGSRLLVHVDVLDQVLAGVRSRAEALRLGNPADPETQMGPVATDQQFDTITGYIQSAIEQGARLVTGGREARGSGLGNGRFVEPTVFVDVAPEMTIAREEVFGPVLCVIPFETEKQAVEIANATRFGLAAGLWTRSLGRAHRVAAAIRAGTVWVNGYRQNDPAVPVGGMKASGLGRESGWSAVREFLEPKSVWINYPREEER